MLTASQNKKSEFQSLVPSNTQNIAEWLVVSGRLPGGTPADMQALAQKLASVYAEKEGIIFQRPDKIVMLQRILATADSGSFKAELDQKLPGRGYSFILRQMTPGVLKQVETGFVDQDEPANSLFQQRMSRGKNAVLVIDDDFFYRTLLRRECETFAEVHQSEDGKDALRLYQEINPDIVFLDIHLPSTPGISILDQITSFDFDAFVIMLSADTSRHNVLQSIKKGAAGILKKPPESGKLVRIFRTCPTFKKGDERKESAKS
jgi:two-component system chemotaxis response regulator CheY